MSDLGCCELEHHQGQCRQFILQFIHVELQCHELRETSIRLVSRAKVIENQILFLSATTPRAGVFTPFVIISDSDNEITTLPMRPVPPSLDRTPALYVYLLNSGDDSSDEDLSDTVKSLHTQSASTSVVHPSPTQSLPASLILANQPKKEIPMPLGYIVAMNR
ncbi:hypothetical protein Tco_0615630 [Tanacetum coccineum]